MTRRILRVTVLVWGVLLVALVIPRLVDFSPGDARHGEALYRGLEPPYPVCTVCHINRAIAPPMSSISRRVMDVLATAENHTKTTELYLVESILYPQRYTVPDYPADAMPGGFGALLSHQDVQDIVAYLMTL